MRRRISMCKASSGHSHLTGFTYQKLFRGIFGGTHEQFGSTNSAGDGSAMVKIVQSIGKILMMNGDEMDAEEDFMPNAVRI